MSEREKYRLLFKQSKGVIKEWEADFFSDHQRKPNKDELASAPEKVILSYKNCKKIKLYFERDEELRKKEKENSPDAIQQNKEEKDSANLSFSGIFPKEACNDISNVEPKVWGAHLNKKIAPVPEAANHKFAGKLAFASETSSTRSSMKKKGRLDKKSLSFFGTLDDSTLGDLSQSILLDDTQSQSSFNLEKSISEPSRLLPADIKDDDSTADLFPEVNSAVAPAATSAKTSTVRQDRCVDNAWLTRCAEVDVNPPPTNPAKSVFQPVTLLATDILPMENEKPRKSNLHPRLADKIEIHDQPREKNIVDEPAKCDPATATTFKGVFEADTKDQSVDEAVVPEPIAVKPIKKRKRSDSEDEYKPEELTSTAGKPSSSKPTARGRKAAAKKPPKRKKLPSDDASEALDEEMGEEVQQGQVRVDEAAATKPSAVEPKKKSKLSDSEEEYKPEAETTSSKPAARGRKVAAKRPSKRKKLNSDEAGEAMDEAKAEEAQHQGPSKMNLFALGFEETIDGGPTSVKTFMTPEQRLAHNASTGKANENYKKIDLKKKSYSKGKTGGKFIKNMEYKRKLAAKEGKSLKEYKCYRCGELGHFSRQCTGGKGDSLIPQDLADEFDAGEFPTLEDARKMATGPNRTNTASSSVQEDAETLNIDADDALLLEAVKQCELAEAQEQELKLTTEPYIGSDKFDSDLIDRTLKMFGYDDFRPGQKEGIMRILRGESSLVLLATGSGKSLIYQLPAYLYAEKYNSITIVVSPLVSLMEDQVTGLPPFLRAAALHYNLSPKLKEKVVEQVKSGKLHFLLVSPESVAGGGGVFGSLIPHLPPIAFVCIDEAHCVSQWSHNFRPSYLRLSKVIREKLGVQTILGLTATAPERMITNVAEQLGVPPGGVIRGPLLPNNLVLTVSRDASREYALLALLSEDGALGDCESVIVYCTRRDDCVKVSTFLRTRLQEREFALSERRKHKTRISATAEPYHAGMPASRRRTVQNHFMSGKLRIVVATVAFGMGIDKSDIRAIVHYNMPKTYESYIQEIGRAGRDGALARCHLFLENEGKDLSELKRHVYSNSMDRFTLRKLLHFIFEVSEEENQATTEYKEVAISVVDTVEALDLPEENISTLLCYLESGSKSDIHRRPWVKLGNPVYSHCRVQCYGGPLQLRSVAAQSPPIAAAIALQRQKGVDFAGASSVEFPVVEISAKMDWKSSVVKKELKNLEWKSTPAGWRKTGVVVNFSNLAFHFEALQGLSEVQLDQLQSEIYERTRIQEFSELSNLLRLHRAFTIVAFKTHEEAAGDSIEERSNKLKEYITSYFVEPEKLLDEVKNVPETCENEGHIRGCVRTFVYDHRDHNWNGRAVARVFHGIQSPNFPAKQWGRVNSWRALLKVDFNLLVKLASDEILKIRTGT